MLQFFHEFVDFLVFFVGWLDGVLGYLFPSELVEVVRDACHEQQLRH